MKVDSAWVGIEESLNNLNKLIQKQPAVLKEGLEYVLIQLINYAKQNGNYTDRTANLRNSLSINYNTMQEWPADTPEATIQGMIARNETPILDIKGDRYRAIVSAGMEYAIWVELLEGYWVLQGAVDALQPLIEKYLHDYISVPNLDVIGMADAAYIKWLQKKGLDKLAVKQKFIKKKASFK